VDEELLFFAGRLNNWGMGARNLPGGTKIAKISKSTGHFSAVDVRSAIREKVFGVIWGPPRQEMVVTSPGGIIPGRLITKNPGHKFFPGKLRGD